MEISPKQNTRILSLDVARGIIMILLAAESTLLYHHLFVGLPEGFAHELVKQFTHHDWHGLRFWDLVQPVFMLIAGTAMYISYYFKKQKGISWNANFRHIIGRCAKLFIAGIALHCVYAGKLVWELWNVLTQLTFTTLIAYLIIQWKPRYQFLFSITLLLLTEALYRFSTVSGFDQPFVDQHNFGNFLDLKLMGVVNSGGWVAINIIPTTAHTIWGVLVGVLMVSSISSVEKVKRLLIYGVLLLMAGYALDLVNITPVIKRISTSSFVFVSGGYVLIILALLSYIVDVRNQTKYAWVFTVVGMNAIFIYLFFETIGRQWYNKTIDVFVGGALRFTPMGDLAIQVIVSFTALVGLWLLCYWLYKRKIFFKI